MSNRTTLAVVLLLLAPGSSGCDGTRSVPTSPSPSVPTAPVPPAIRLDTVAGTVYDTAFRRLTGASVEVLDGPDAGRMTTTTASGEFSLSGNFDETTRFRIARPGYASITLLHPHGYIDFYLVSSEAPVNLTGEYEMTFTADPSCAGIPESVRTRTYRASITPTSFERVPAGMAFGLSLEGVGALDNPAIGVSGDAVGFRLFNDGFPFIVERVTSDLYLTITGWAEVADWSAGGPVISVPFDGWIAALNGPPMPGTQTGGNCKSEHHTLTISRR